MDVNRRLGAGVFLLALAGSAGADTPNERALKQFTDDRELSRQQQRRDELHAPTTPFAAPLSELAQPIEPPRTSAAPCFPVQRIHLTPASVLPARRVAALIAPYIGRCLQAQDLAALQTSLNSMALAQGWVTTRVLIPEQSLLDGLLQLQVVAGRLSAVTAPDLHPRELAQAAPLRTGDVLQLRALEQTLDNLNRLASLQARMTLRPGTESGSSVADFSVQRASPWQAHMLWQQEGLGGTASSQSLRGSLTQDSPLQWADRLTLGLNATLTDLQVDDAHGASVDYDLPFGWWRASVSADQFNYQNAVHAGLNTFIASGSSRSWRGEVGRLAYRDARYRLTLSAHGKQRQNDNFVAGVLVGVSSYRLSAAGLRADFSRTAAPWVWDAMLDTEQGHAQPANPLAAMSANYRRVLANTRLHYQGTHASVSASANAQWSKHALAPSEQLTLTAAVAGFLPLSLNTHSGYGARLESAWPRAVAWAGFTQWQPSVALAWAAASHLAGQLGGAHIGAFSADITGQWRSATARAIPGTVFRAGVSLPMAALSSVNAAEPWLASAGVTLSW